MLVTYLIHIRHNPKQELIALYEAGRECVWLRSMIQHIQEECGLESIKGNPTILYEDNTTCIAQINE